MGSKQHLVMKFDQFKLYYKRKKLSKNSTINVAQKLAAGPFVFIKNQAQPLLEKKFFETNCLLWICNAHSNVRYQNMSK